MKLGQFIRQRREQLKLSQAAIGRHVGFCSQYITALEKGRIQLRAADPEHILNKLGEILQVDHWYLYYLAGRIPPDLMDIGLSEHQVIHMFTSCLEKRYGAG